MAAITLDIAGNTRQLDRDIQKTVNRVYSINLKTKGDQPLGRITGKVNEFTKSLDASNARVIAFGASAGIIFGLERAFTALVSSTIQVQKSLQDINVILNVSTEQLNKFGGQLFNIARNTGQGFQEVAKAATEFSRQGLGVEETLKRTNEALILSRLSGLDAAKSVESLTAAVNSFANQAVTATEVVNKFATVDAAFAVSSADLADAIARVGSSAAQSGVSLNELIAIVTSAQQTTARGGAVIGNSFKTIFTRLQREKVVDLLESLGISSTDSSGQVKSTIQLLQDLGKVYDTLGAQQQAYVAEQVGGVFQINILKAALADLGKEYSIYSSALNVAAGATDQAIRRNEELNKTYSAQINALAENARQLAAAGGERLLGPSIDRLVGGTNTLLKGFSESDGQGVGAVLGKGILDGLGQFIAGPGLALIGGVLLKLFRDLAKFATGSVQQLLGLNTAATQQRDLQQSINQILAKNPQLLQLALQGEQGLNQAANTLLASLQKQTVELQKQATVASQISKAFVAQAGVRVSGGVPVVPTKRAGKAAGYIPNFAKDDFAREELLATALGAKNPTAQLSKGTIDGRRFIKNNREIEITNFGKNGDSAVLPTYAKGFIPNFAYNKILPTQTTIDPTAKFRGQNIEALNLSTYDKKQQKKIVNYQQKYGYLLPPGFGSGQLIGSPKYNIPPGIKFASPQPSKIKTTSDPQEQAIQQDLEGLLLKRISESVSQYTNTLSPLGKSVSPTAIQKEFGRNAVAGARGALRSVTGSAFEVGITRALGYEAAAREKGGDFDVRGGKNLAKVQELFGISSPLMDFKVSLSRGNLESFYDKIAKEEKIGGKEFSAKEKEENARKIARQALKDKYPNLFQERGFVPLQGLTPEQKNRLTQVEQRLIKQIVKNRYSGLAAGYIPNFAAIQDAVSRERAAGIPSNQIYLAQEKALTSANPMGLGVFNKRDEPTKQSRKDAMRRKGFASGYIPNFAIEDPDVQGASPETATAAIISALSGVAFAFAFTGNQFKDSLKELTIATKATASAQRNQLAKDIRERRNLGAPNAAIKQSLAAERAAAKQASTPGIIAKGGAFGRANALGLSIAAPILGEIIKNAVGQETAGARQFGAVASGAGQIGSFAATGALIAKGGGPIGLAIGALLTIPGIVNEFTTEMPELAAAAKKASQDLTKFSDVSQRLLTASSSLSEFTDKGASPEKLKKVQDDFAKALAELTPAERARIESSIKVGNLEEELAKITQERIDQEKLRSQAVSIRSIEERKGALGLFPAGFDPNTAQGRIDEETIRSVFKGFFTGKTPEETLENFNQAARSGVPQLEELIKTVGTLTKAQQIYSSGSLEQFRGILESIIPQGNTPDEQDFRSRFIKDLVELADEGDIKALQNVLQIPIKSLTRDRQQLEEGIESAKRAAESTAIFNKVKEKYTGIIDNSISSLNKTIATFNALANALDKFQVNEKSFEREQGVGGLGLRKNIAETVLGPEAELTRRAALFEKIAQNEANRLDAIDQSNLTFRENFRENLKDVFTERAGEIATTKGQTATTIPEQANVANEVLRAVKLFESGAIDINKILEDSFKDGAIDPDQFKSALGDAFKAAEFKTPATNKILDSILSVAEEQNANLLDINQKASQANQRAAQEFANEKILLDIRRSLQVFGGIEQFLTPPEGGIAKPLETLIKSATGQLQAQRGFEFARRTGAGTSFGTEAQVQNNIALGQSALNFITQLQDLSGGAFTPDPDSELYRRAAAGLTQSFEKNIKQLNDVLKDPKVDQAFKFQIQATLDAIRGLGSNRELAQLQIAKKTGSAFQSTLEGTLSRLQDPGIQQLQEAGLNKLANEVANSAQYTADPIVNVLGVQRGIQVGIAEQLEKITTILSKQPGGPTPSQSISPPIDEDSVDTNAKGFIPAFNKESRSIKRGVGGAKPGDRPQFIPNLNGSPAFINSGEKLVDNFGGSGQTAVLTRNMQKAMGMAKGFIPNFAEENKNAKFGRTIGLEDTLDSLIPFFEDIWNRFQVNSTTKLASVANSGKNIFKSGAIGIGAEASTQYALDNLFHGGKKSENPYIDQLEKIFSTAVGGAASGLAIGKNPLAAVYGAITSLGIGAGKDLLTIGAMIPDLISSTNGAVFAEAQTLKLKEKLLKSGKLPPGTTPDNLAGGFIPNFAGGQQIVSPESFKPIGAEVTKILDSYPGKGFKKGQKIVEILTDKPLDNSFRGSTVNFGENVNGKIGYIIGRSSAAYVGMNDNEKLPIVGTRFKINSNAKPIQLNDEQKQDLIKKYTEDYKEALKLYEGKEYQSAYWRFKELKGTQLPDVTKNIGEFVTTGDQSIKFYQQEIDKYLNIIWKKLNPGLVKDPIYKTIKDQVDKKYGPKTKNSTDQIQKAAAASKTDLLTDATIRAAKITSTLGKYTGLNIGSDNPLGLAGEQIATRIVENEGRGAVTIGSKVKYKGKPGINTVLNEATAVNQNILPEGADPFKELDKVDEFINQNGGPDKYVDRLIKIADFLEQQNKAAQNKFLRIADIEQFSPKPGFVFSGANKRDRRIFGDITGDFTISEAKWKESGAKGIQERISTLFGFLGTGITAGEITAEELALLGIPLDVAKNIVAETIAIDKQLKEQKPYQAQTPKPIVPPPALPGIPTVTPSPKTPSGPPELPSPKVTPTTPSPKKPIIPRATPITPTAIPTPVSSIGGKISEQTARAIIQELDANYNEAIRNQRNPEIARAWAQTQQRYRLLYAQGKYAELDRFYQSLTKNYQKPIGQGTGRPGESVQQFAKGFIPNFAYKNSVMDLEEGLSGNKAIYSTKPFPHIRNSSQPTFASAISDHGGLDKALKDSMKGQKSAGLMSRGYIPNFAVTEQSFTQQEAAFNNNTSAITSLTAGIENLASTVSTLQNQITAQETPPTVQTQPVQNQQNNTPRNNTTVGPFNVVVNQTQSNITVQINKAMEKLKAEILRLVDVKVPPTTTPNRVSP